MHTRPTTQNQLLIQSGRLQPLPRPGQRPAGDPGGRPLAQQLRGVQVARVLSVVLAPSHQIHLDKGRLNEERLLVYSRDRLRRSSTRRRGSTSPRPGWAAAARTRPWCR